MNITRAMINLEEVVSIVYIGQNDCEVVASRTFGTCMVLTYCVVEAGASEAQQHLHQAHCTKLPP